MSLAIWDHTVLPGVRHKWTHPTFTPTRGWYSIYLSRRDRRLSWPRWPVTYWEGLPAHRRSPIQVLTQQCTTGSRTRNLLRRSATWRYVWFFDTCNRFLERCSLANATQRSIAIVASVRLSVRLSHADIVTKLIHLRSRDLHRRIAPSF